MSGILGTRPARTLPPAKYASLVKIGEAAAAARRRYGKALDRSAGVPREAQLLLLAWARQDINLRETLVKAAVAFLAVVGRRDFDYLAASAEAGETSGRAGS